jgi:hypothetical protein
MRRRKKRRKETRGGGGRREIKMRRCYVFTINLPRTEGILPMLSRSKVVTSNHKQDTVVSPNTEVRSSRRYSVALYHSGRPDF